MPRTKGLIRSHVRTGVADRKVAPPNRRTGAPPDPSACERCGAVWRHKTWRRAGRVSARLLDEVHWTVCPACAQAERGIFHGRVLLRGGFVLAHEAEIRRRIRNVAARARFTQPERRVGRVDREPGALEVFTTSQKLAHRIVSEMKKLYRGRARYEWAPSDGSLFAVWERDDARA